MSLGWLYGKREERAVGGGGSLGKPNHLKGGEGAIDVGGGRVGKATLCENQFMKSTVKGPSKEKTSEENSDRGEGKRGTGTWRSMGSRGGCKRGGKKKKNAGVVRHRVGFFYFG